MVGRLPPNGAPWSAVFVLVALVIAPLSAASPPSSLDDVLGAAEVAPDADLPDLLATRFIALVAVPQGMPTTCSQAIVAVAATGALPRSDIPLLLTCPGLGPDPRSPAFDLSDGPTRTGAVLATLDRHALAVAPDRRPAMTWSDIVLYEWLIEGYSSIASPAERARLDALTPRLASALAARATAADTDALRRLSEVLEATGPAGRIPLIRHGYLAWASAFGHDGVCAVALDDPPQSRDAIVTACAPVELPSEIFGAESPREPFSLSLGRSLLARLVEASPDDSTRGRFDAVRAALPPLPPTEEAMVDRIKEAVHTRLPDLSACGAPPLRRGPPPTLPWNLDFTLMVDGTTENVYAYPGDAPEDVSPDPQLEACIVGAVDAWVLPSMPIDIPVHKTLKFTNP